MYVGKRYKINLYKKIVCNRYEIDSELVKFLSYLANQDLV